MEKPYWVQAYRTGQHTQWFTDSRHDTVEAAIAAAHTLHDQWGRKVRVIDQEERVHLRLPPRVATAMKALILIATLVATACTDTNTRLVFKLERQVGPAVEVEGNYFLPRANGCVEVYEHATWDMSRSVAVVCGNVHTVTSRREK